MFGRAAANKYRNVPVTVDGIGFASKKEAGIYEDLKRMQAAGEIKDFARQVKYVLIPNQLGPDGKVLERAITYIADFVVHYPDGEVVVIDCKGARNLDQKYGLKRKLMLWVHRIRIKEV